MTRTVRTHTDLLIGIVAALAGVFLACVLGPTLDSTTVAKDGGRTAYAARQ